MNFLLRHSFSSSDLPLVSDAETENKAASETGGSLHTSMSTVWSGDSVVEDVRAVGAAGSAVDVWRTRNRMAIEDHTDVPADGGGILIPCRQLTEDWHLSGDVTSMLSLDRGFVFPGERLNIVVYVSSHDHSVPEIITPFRVAAMMNKAGVIQQKGDKGGDDASSIGDPHGISDGSSALGELQHVAVEEKESSLPSGKVILPVSESLLRMEGQKKRSAALLECFQNSHFLTRIAEADEPLWKKRTAFDQHSEVLDQGKVSADQLEQRKPIQSIGSVPVVLEGGKFDPKIAGGVARNAATCCSFGNGDIVVVLQLTVATDLKDDAVLEILQFEQPWNQDRSSAVVRNDIFSQDQSESGEGYLDSSQLLLQWLLPLDRPSSPPPPPPVPATPASFVNSSPQRLSFAGSSSSTLFSFGNLRSSSTGSTSQNAQLSISSTPPHSASNYGSEEWDRLAAQKVFKGQDVGSEGLLSFRGAQLEPQRFSAHCGLEGLYVPGKRWRRKIEIVEPVAIESYFANCNTEDLICVLIENVVPSHLPGVVIIVDSISIICQSAGPNSTPLSVPIACVEVGEDHHLPGLSLRPGEQHSFILKPSNSPLLALVTERDKNGSTSTLHRRDLQTTNGTPLNNSYYASVGRKNTKDHMLNFPQESSSYALVVSCRCSHTESRLRFKHSLQWQPRAPRDLLLSVALEPATAPVMPNGTLPPLLSQVLTVQATNLTSENLNLTLLAPSSRNSTLSVPAFPAFPASPVAPRMSNFMSFRERKERMIAKDAENDYERDQIRPDPSIFRSASLQRSMSLPPVRPIESIMGISPRVVKERAISAVDIAAENNSARTHLWLQSTVPLGSVPPQSTTAVRCELLPLTDGIITLDTLHIATKERDVLYTPEQPLQIYATSGIGSGLS